MTFDNAEKFLRLTDDLTHFLHMLPVTEAKELEERIDELNWELVSEGTSAQVRERETERQVNYLTAMGR